MEERVNRNNLSVLNCSLSTGENIHFCYDPRSLSCGHYVCKQCYEFCNYSSIECTTCGKMNTKDLKRNEEAQFFNMIFEHHIKELFGVLVDRFQSNFKRCVEIFSKNDDRVDAIIQFVKEEIEVKIESLKIELDDLNQVFNQQLDEIGKKWKNENQMVLNKLKPNFNEEHIINELNELKENIENENYLRKDELFNCQNKITLLQNLLNDFNKNDLRIEFKESELHIGRDFIGKLELRKMTEQTQIMSRINDKIYENYDIFYKAVDLCPLPNGNLLVCSEFELQLYDIDLKLIKTVEKLSNALVTIVAATTDGNDKIYLCEQVNYKIIKTDFELNRLGQSTIGEKSERKLSGIKLGICYYNDHVYVSDSCKKRLIKFDVNLEFKGSVELDFTPKSIKCIHSVALINSMKENQDDLSSVYFYDLVNFVPIREYDGHSGIICESKLNFYEYDFENKKLFIYNQHGNLFETHVACLCEVPHSLCVFRSRLYCAHSKMRMGLLTIF